MKPTIVFPFETIWEKSKIFQSCRLLESCRDLFKKSSVKRECHDKCVASDWQSLNLADPCERTVIEQSENGQSIL